MIVYIATNRLSGKIYIGQTIQSLHARKNKHISDAKNGSDNYFHRAICKYGINSFKWEILQICKNIDDLNEREQYYILYYDSMASGYNLTSGGLNFIQSEETKKKISKNSARLSGKDHPMYGKHHSESAKEKSRMAQLDRKFSEEHKKKLRENHVGMLDKKHSAESIKKISGKNNHNHGKHPSEETIKKIKESNIRTWYRKRGIYIEYSQFCLFKTL